MGEYEVDSLTEGLNVLFNHYVKIPRIKHGKRKEIKSVINEEAMLLANFIRGKKLWEARIVPLPIITIPRTYKSIISTFKPFFPKQ